MTDLNETVFAQGVWESLSIETKTLINSSDILVSSLNSLGANTIIFGEISNTGGAFYDNTNIVIDPDSLGSPTFLGLLAHEVGHAADRRGHGSSSVMLSTSDAVSSGISNEAYGTLHEYRVILELQGKGISITMHSGPRALAGDSLLEAQLKNLPQQDEVGDFSAIIALDVALGGFVDAIKALNY